MVNRHRRPTAPCAVLRVEEASSHPLALAGAAMPVGVVRVRNRHVALLLNQGLRAEPCHPLAASHPNSRTEAPRDLAGVKNVQNRSGRGTSDRGEDPVTYRSQHRRCSHEDHPFALPRLSVLAGQIRLSPRPPRCRSGASGSPPTPHCVAAAERISGLGQRPSFG
jgi:hypothetical protein